MKTSKRICAAAAAFAVSVCAVSAPAQLPAVAYGTGQNIAEYLDRGITAVKTGSGMLVSWRFLANDSDTAEFQLYRGDELIYTSSAGKATCFLDKGGNASSTYRVDTYAGGKKVSSDTCTMISGNSYFDIPLDIPAGGTTPSGETYSYSANDCSVGDVDGDGIYEIFLKWDPSNAHDNSQAGYTGNVLIDCYRLTGEKLWRIDLGRNIRAGAHYTQFLVADFDGDGKCEMTCKTADGSKDAAGKIIGDGSKDWRNQDGYVLSGPEYYSLFDGATGTLLDTVDYAFPRGTVSQWGDKYGNRVDRFLGTVAYLDGVHPSAVSIRGYYTRMTAVAYDVQNKKLVKRWTYDSGWDQKAGTGWGNGNHNCMPADVDGDGKDEILCGAFTLDDNGNALWCTNKLHGDAMHVSDFDPSHAGQELWVCHEASPYGVSLVDAKTGQILWHEDRSKDTGRACADNVWAGNPGGEFWGSCSTAVVNSKGQQLSMSCPSINFLVWWDGDLERELLDGNTITKVNQSGGIDTLFTANGCDSCNGTKATPNLSADLFGDWREEVILHTSDSKYLRIFCTPYETDVRLTTLMHDMQYRMQVATEQNCYNQPPHPSFYLGSDQPLPERPAVTINGGVTVSDGPAIINTEPVYQIRNLGRGWNLSGVNGKAMQTGPALSEEQVWKFSDLGDGKYTLTNGYDEVLTFPDGKPSVTKDFQTGDKAVTLKRVKGGYLIIPVTDGDDENVLSSTMSNDLTLKAFEENNTQIWVLEEFNAHMGKRPNITFDINGDRKVTAADLSAWKAASLSGTQNAAADCNGDGKTDSTDMQMIQTFLRGERVLFRDESVFRIRSNAIDAGWDIGIEETVNEGFKAPAYLNLDNREGSFAEFTVYVPESGAYFELRFRYANGSSNNRTMAVWIDGMDTHETLDFSSTGSWTNWKQEAVYSTRIGNGYNTIRLISQTNEGGPNLDYLELIPHPIPMPEG